MVQLHPRVGARTPKAGFKRRDARPPSCGSNTLGYYLGYGASQDDLDRTLAGYAGNVGYLDECIGHLLESIDHLGYAEDTFVIYTSDHGEMAGAHDLWHKQMFYEESARVPFLLRGPGVPRGKRCVPLSV